MKGINNNKVRKEVWVSKKAIKAFEQRAKEKRWSLKQTMELALEDAAESIMNPSR